MGITNSWTAYQLDNAAMLAGLDHEVKNRRDSKRKRKTSALSVPKADSGFSSLKTAVGPDAIRKIKIPENGIW